MSRIEVPVTIKFVVFGIDEEYQTFVFLNEHGLPSFEYNGGFLANFVKKSYKELLKFDSEFSPPNLVDVHGDLDEPGIIIFYSINIPKDTLNLEGFKWVKPNETTTVQTEGDDRVKLSGSDYKAIFQALGKRQYEHFASSPRKA